MYCRLTEFTKISPYFNSLTGFLVTVVLAEFFLAEVSEGHATILVQCSIHLTGHSRFYGSTTELLGRREIDPG